MAAGMSPFLMEGENWLAVSIFFPFHIWDNPSHWRTHIFQDGYCTTNQESSWANWGWFGTSLKFWVLGCSGIMPRGGFMRRLPRVVFPGSLPRNLDGAGGSYDLNIQNLGNPIFSIPFPNFKMFNHQIRGCTLMFSYSATEVVINRDFTNQSPSRNGWVIKPSPDGNCLWNLRHCPNLFIL